MPGHPNQRHITSSTAKCQLDANSEGPDKRNMSLNRLICTAIVGHEIILALMVVMRLNRI